MNKLIVLAKNKETYFIKRLTSEVGLDRCLIHDPWEGPMPDADTILVRTTGVYGSDLDLQMARDSKKKVVNPTEALEVFRSKRRQFEWFERNAIPQLPWLDLQCASIESINKFVVNNPMEKYLIKPHRGQGGWGIEVLSTQEILAWHEKSTDREFILQPYLEGAMELRLFFISDVFECTLRRIKAPGARAANFRQEGEAEVVKAHERLQRIRKIIQAAIPIHYGALEVLIFKDELFVLELNLVPGIEQLERVSGENVIKHLLKSLPQIFVT